MSQIIFLQFLFLFFLIQYKLFKMSLIIPEISKEELLKQTLEKFKTFLVRDLKIDEQRLDSVEGLYENINLLKRVKPFIAMIGQGNVTEYVSDKLIAHFSLKEINQDQKEKLNEYLGLFLELIE
uniref:Tlr 5Fp protein n=1 Tax=Tetrahymena thermophila TaxID=5911 RepID=Q8WRA8_TETTH|nr:Tlr 5Fp protein [Tetrahymena thermophila]